MTSAEAVPVVARSIGEEHVIVGETPKLCIGRSESRPVVRTTVDDRADIRSSPVDLMRMTGSRWKSELSNARSSSMSRAITSDGSTSSQHGALALDPDGTIAGVPRAHIAEARST